MNKYTLKDNWLCKNNEKIKEFNFMGNFGTSEEKIIVARALTDNESLETKEECEVFYNNMMLNEKWYKKYFYTKILVDNIISVFWTYLEIILGIICGAAVLHRALLFQELNTFYFWGFSATLGTALVHYLAVIPIFAKATFNEKVSWAKKILGIEEKKSNELEQLREKNEEDKEKELDAFIKQIHSDIVVLTKNPYPGAKKDGEELQKLAMQYLEYKQALSNEGLMQRIAKKVAPKLANVNVKPFYDRLNEMEDKIMIKIKNYTMMQKNMSVINGDVEAILEPTLDTSSVELNTGMKLSLTKSDENKRLG